MPTAKTKIVKKKTPAKKKDQKKDQPLRHAKKQEASIDSAAEMEEISPAVPAGTEISLERDDEADNPHDFIPLDEQGDDQSDETRSRRPDRYFEAVGRRKTAVARVRLFTRAGDFSVNGKPYEHYFATLELQRIVEDSLKKMKLFGRFRVSAKMSGGGMHSQAEALRHGLARCLVKFNPDFRKRLRRAGFMTRDPRVKERKKFGLKKARKAPQWAKR